MEIHGVPEPAPAPDNGGRRDSSFLRRAFARIRRRRVPPSEKFPFSRTLLPLAIALLAFLAYQFCERSLRPVQPGHVGVAVNRFTGGLEVLPPGTHFRPRALYQIDLVRVSDRLLSGSPGNFSISTKDGVVAQVSVQARWAIDRARLPAKWAALPPDPERELVAPVLAAAFRSIAPRYEVGRIVSEKREELANVARQYGLHSTSVEDSLDPEHLPKYERIGAVTFIIIRTFDEAATRDCSTVQEMTRKVAIFFSNDFLITIHRTEQPFLTALVSKYQSPPPSGAERRKSFLPRLLIEIINDAIDTYGRPLAEAESAIDKFEATVFGEHELGDVLQRVYTEKRRVTQMRRMLSHTLDVVQRLVPASEPTAPLFQDLRENAESMYSYAEGLVEDVNNLLSIQLALAQHRTSEVVRVLTVFSVFFLPLTFIVGIYGMNFDFMPELRQRWGYPAILVGMGLVTLAIFLWFRRRGWLRG